MDLFVGAKLLERFATADETEGSSHQASSWSISDIVILVIVAGIFAFGAYLSWSCNTVAGEQIGWKLFYAFFSGLNGLFYSINYYVFKMNTVVTYACAVAANPVAVAGTAA